MGEISLLLIVGLMLGFYMAFGIGANDAANSMGTSVGSKALTLFQALLLCALFEFLGATLVGKHVAETIRKGILDTGAFQGHWQDLALGMTASLLAGAIWLHGASLLGLPVSTTHSIVGAVLGFGIIGAGVDAVNWMKAVTIVLSWLTSPIVGMIMAFVMVTFIHRLIMKREDAGRAAAAWSPLFVFLVFAIITLSAVYKGMPRLKLHLPLGQALLMAGGVGGLTAFVAWAFTMSRRRNAREPQVESIFRGLQILTACMMAFSHGANDVANAIGPLAAVWTIENGGDPGAEVPVPLGLLVLGGVGIIIGLFTLGRHVIETVGTRITELTPSRGFAAEFSCATTVLVCSKIGIPVSTTHTIVGAVIGVGLARGVAALDLRVVRNIIVSWLVNVPAVGLIAGGLYWLGKLAWS